MFQNCKLGESLFCRWGGSRRPNILEELLKYHESLFNLFLRQLVNIVMVWKRYNNLILPQQVLLVIFISVHTLSITDLDIFSLTYVICSTDYTSPFLPMLSFYTNWKKPDNQRWSVVLGPVFLTHVGIWQMLTWLPTGTHSADRTYSATKKF